MFFDKKRKGDVIKIKAKERNPRSKWPRSKEKHTDIIVMWIEKKC